MYALAIFLPLIGAVLAGFGGRWLQDRGAQVVTCVCMLVSAAIACVILAEVALGGEPRTIELFSWINSGTFEVNWTLRFDTLTAVMVFVVTVVSSMVHVYSASSRSSC
jgi:NADH-quinone oxidoreductase subunit L